MLLLCGIKSQSGEAPITIAWLHIDSGSAKPDKKIPVDPNCLRSVASHCMRLVKPFCTCFFASALRA